MPNFATLSSPAFFPLGFNQFGVLSNGKPRIGISHRDSNGRHHFFFAEDGRLRSNNNWSYVKSYVKDCCKSTNVVVVVKKEKEVVPVPRLDPPRVYSWSSIRCQLSKRQINRMLDKVGGAQRAKWVDLNVFTFGQPCILCMALFTCQVLKAKALGVQLSINLESPAIVEIEVEDAGLSTDSDPESVSSEHSG